MTAGHCVYSDVTSEGNYQDDTDNPTYPDSIELYFGMNGLSELTPSYDYYATASVEDIILDSHYISSQNTNYDWAILKLDNAIGEETGWYPIITDTSLKDCSIKSYGYPKSLGYSMYETSGTVSKVKSNKIINNLDTSGGQSGSPYFITIDGKDYVCGIHTNGMTTYNYGTILYSDLYDEILSVIGEYYNYLSLSINSKSSGTWSITIENRTDSKLTCEYNSKMCNLNDAKYWTNLEDISTVTISSGSKAIVYISENWFATSIACSYIVDGFRIITYANKLKKSGSLSCYYSVVIED
ncbi:MAG: hypothetical protein LUE27_11160 [Clostridia bacterium]|nr:hypothetical protein [Clostridia bacterium]